MGKKIKVNPKNYTKPKVITAKQNEEYLLIDENTKKAPNKIKLVKINNNLEIYFEGNEYYPSVIIENYYVENMNASIVGINTSDNFTSNQDNWKHLDTSNFLSSFDLPLWTSILGVTTIVGSGIIIYKNKSDDNTKTPETSSSHISPIVLDLNNDGINTVSIDNGVLFDLNGDLKIEKTAWIDQKDGFLVLDINKDGIINNGLELFGEGSILTNGTKAKNGYEALAQYDLNKDNVINSNDNIFELLQIWIDKNSDTNSSNDELYTLSQLEIKSLSLASENSNSLNNGNLLGLVSTWEDINNNNHKMADVWFQTQEINSTTENLLAYSPFIYQSTISDEQSTSF